MTRKTIVVLLRIVSVLFFLWGIQILCFVSRILLESHASDEHPVAFLALVYSSACILLGFLSWGCADRFRSSWDALLLLIARIISFIIASAFVVGVGAQFEGPTASTLGMHLYAVIIQGVFAYFFFRLTFTLALLNNEKSCETQDFPNQRINTDQR